MAGGLDPQRSVGASRSDSGRFGPDVMVLPSESAVSVPVKNRVRLAASQFRQVAVKGRIALDNSSELLQKCSRCARRFLPAP